MGLQPHALPFILGASLRVDPPLLDGESHPINRQHISRNAIVHVMRFRVPNHIVKAVPQNRLQFSFTIASFQK